MPHDFALTLEADAVTPLRPVTTWRLPPAAVLAEGEGAFARPFVPGTARPGSWPAGDRSATAAPEETRPAPADAPAEDLGLPWEDEEAAPGYEESYGVATGISGDPLPPVDADIWTATLDTGRAAPAWEDERPDLEEAGQPDQPFPLDAFLIPENTTRLPAGLENDRELQDRIAAEVADALSTMVTKLRSDGLDALLSPSARREPVDVVLAAVLSGYLSRRTH